MKFYIFFLIQSLTCLIDSHFDLSNENLGILKPHICNREGPYQCQHKWDSIDNLTKMNAISLIFIGDVKNFWLGKFCKKEILNLYVLLLKF
jgi:hypothetical protein